MSLIVLPRINAWVAVLAFAFCCLMALSARPKSLGGMMIISATLLAAASIASLHHGKPQNHYLNHIKDSPQRACGIIHERIKNGRNSQRYVVCLERIGKIRCTGKILLNVKGELSPMPPGARIIFETRFVPNRNPLNPGQFDYKSYLENQTIHAQAYVESSSLIAGASAGGWRFHFDRVRQRAMSGIAASGMTADAMAVLNALVLGQRQELDRGLIRDYEIAGAVHILSVSGLHVGFVMMAIGMLLRPLPKNAHGRVTRLLVQWSCLWGFAALTGLSPSVVRSAAMFSLLAAGESLRRPQNRFHTLMVSALLILLADPSLLRDVGFQLSYAAVIFIVWLYPRLREIWSPGNALLQYIRDILAVSIAAQAGTLPLCLYYFHQFPGLFLLTNLVVIPLVTIIMLLGLLVIAIAIFTPVPKPLIAIIENCIRLMNGAISKIASVDKLTLPDLPCTLNMAIALSIVICAISFLIWRPTKQRAIATIVAVLLFQATVLHDRRRAFSTSELIVFHDRKSHAIAVRHGRIIKASCDSPNEFLLRPYRIQALADKQLAAPASALLYFAGKKILVARKETAWANVRPDILILTGSPEMNLERVLEQSRPQVIVADGTNFKSYVRRWSTTCQKKKIPFHSTSEKGYFKISG